MIEIRAIGPDDWWIWRDLRLAALAGSPEAFGSRLADWQGADEQRWRDRLSVGHRHLIALLDGTPVGMVAAVPANRTGAVELISLYVEPAARGTGVGDRLVGAVVDWARDSGASAVRLNVIADNGAATALYRRNGFVPTGDEPDSGCEIVMARPTDPAPSH